MSNSPPCFGRAAATPDSTTCYLNKNRQSSGDHGVHREDCREAKRGGYPTADGGSFYAQACDHE